MLSVGVLTAMNMTERKQPSDLTMLNIEAMAWSIESFAKSFSDCYFYTDANCCVIEISGDGRVVSTDHPNFIAKNN